MKAEIIQISQLETTMKNKELRYLMTQISDIDFKIQLNFLWLKAQLQTLNSLCPMHFSSMIIWHFMSS